ncbi:MAG: hypothetical protein M0Q53_01820 [Prolixibacteraceae bacterium]|jgi:hypothetical protein|nr:hypothetical protein [Prolixibacteraceae bacterium]
MTLPKDRSIIASDVIDRDGIGVEIFCDDKFVIEIFHDDSKRTRTVTLYQQDISLDLPEESIQTFKKEISWDFVDYDNFK